MATVTYTMGIKCENCFHTWDEKIPMGQGTGGKWKCSYCGRLDGVVSWNPNQKFIIPTSPTQSPPFNPDTPTFPVNPNFHYHDNATPCCDNPCTWAKPK